MEDVLEVSSEHMALLKEEAAMVGDETLMRYVRIFSELSNQIRQSSQKRVLIEIALIKLCRPQMEQDYEAIVDRFGDNPAAMKQAGIAYATEQIIDLIANHVNGIHVYSMNKPDVAAGIQRNLSEILKA